MKIRHLFALLALLACSLFRAGLAEASFIPLPPNPPPLGSSYAPNFFTTVSAATVNYDAGAQIFTASNAFAIGVIGVRATITPLINDIFGVFSLTANVDHTGNVSGGTYSLTGGSATLGLPAATMLMSGQILDGGYNPANNIINFLITVSANPAFESALGASTANAVLDITLGSFDFSTTSGRQTPTTNPDVSFIASVAEPMSGALLLSGLSLLVGFGLIARRKARR